MKIVFEIVYARQQTLPEATEIFIEELTRFFGGSLTLKKREVLRNDKSERMEEVLFSNGYHLGIGLARDTETYEIRAAAIHLINGDYIQKVTQEDWDYLLSLVVQRSLSLTEIPGLDHTKLTEIEKIEAEILTYLVPKLMIINGKATEENF